MSTFFYKKYNKYNNYNINLKYFFNVIKKFADYLRVLMTLNANEYCSSFHQDEKQPDIDLMNRIYYFQHTY